jgi:hypothetical protein
MLINTFWLMARRYLCSLLCCVAALSLNYGQAATAKADLVGRNLTATSGSRNAVYVSEELNYRLPLLYVGSDLQSELLITNESTASSEIACFSAGSTGDDLSLTWRIISTTEELVLENRRSILFSIPSGHTRRILLQLSGAAQAASLDCSAVAPEGSADYRAIEADLKISSRFSYLFDNRSGIQSSPYGPNTGLPLFPWSAKRYLSSRRLLNSHFGPQPALPNAART